MGHYSQGINAGVLRRGVTVLTSPSLAKHPEYNLKMDPARLKLVARPSKCKKNNHKFLSV